MSMTCAALLVWIALRPIDDTEKSACRDAAESGQQLRSEGRLLDARERFFLCAKDTCPRVIQIDCARWADEIEASLPTLVFHATDRGRDITLVSVAMDGRDLKKTLDGKAIAVDPGAHRFTFTYHGASITEAIVANEGEKNRQVVARFGTVEESVAPPPAVERAPQAIPPGTWALGGVGAAALASFSYFGLTGRADLRGLRSGCAPFCTDAQVVPVRRELLAADVSLVIGAVALGVAAYLLIANLD